MLRNLLILGVCAGPSASIPISTSPTGSLSPPVVGRRGAPPNRQPRSPYSGAAGSEVLLGRKVAHADRRGHFIADFKLNGRSDRGDGRHRRDAGRDQPVDGTHASASRSTADDFKYEVKTANGVTRAAIVDIERLQIGRILVENVDAAVLDDTALDSTLIGMSFLNRLTKFQVENGALLLVQ